MSDFEKLLGELEALSSEQETLAKAMSESADDADDEKIKAAAEEGMGEAEDEKSEGEAEGDDKDEDDAPMAKSFQVTMPDGSVVEAQDGTALVKSLRDRLDATEQSMTKALEQASTLIKGQTDLIKSLQSQVQKLAGAGRGRKAVVSVAEKPAPAGMAKSETPGISGEEFMAKAIGAMKAGRLTGMQVSIAEACLNRGQAVPADIIASVLN